MIITVAGEQIPCDTRESIGNAYEKFKSADTVANMFGVSTSKVY